MSDDSLLMMCECGKDVSRHQQGRNPWELYCDFRETMYVFRPVVRRFTRDVIPAEVPAGE